MSEAIKPSSYTTYETVESATHLLTIADLPYTGITLVLPFGGGDEIHLANYATEIGSSYTIMIDPLLVEKGKRGEKLPEGYEIVVTERKISSTRTIM